MQHKNKEIILKNKNKKSVEKANLNNQTEQFNLKTAQEKGLNAETCKINKIHKTAFVDKLSVIQESEISANVVVEQSYIDNSFVDENTTIGPFAHLRPNCRIGKNCKIGNFCEIKNSTIGNGTKISHLAYVGDAEIGNNCNIGCGVIFANYNGKTKNKIIVGNNVFIGSNCNLIAPLTIGDNVYICAGTTVTENLQENDFVIGRNRQTVKKQRAEKYLKDREKK